MNEWNVEWLWAAGMKEKQFMNISLQRERELVIRETRKDKRNTLNVPRRTINVRLNAAISSQIQNGEWFISHKVECKKTVETSAYKQNSKRDEEKKIRHFRRECFVRLWMVLPFPLLNV